MSTVILIIHLLLALALVAVILVQRSEGGGLGIGGGGMSGFMTSRGTANFLTRTTAILATCFICTSLLLAYLGKKDYQPISILEAEETPDLDALEILQPDPEGTGTPTNNDPGNGEGGSSGRSGNGSGEKTTQPVAPGVPLD